MNYLLVKNYTGFFSRRISIRGIPGVIKFNFPVLLESIIFFILFLVIWSFPLFYLLGGINGYYLILYFSIPTLVGFASSLTIWNGRTLSYFLLDLFNFLFEPKVWLDTFSSNGYSESYYIDSKIWVSRRRDYAKLKKMRDESFRREKEARRKR